LMVSLAIVQHAKWPITRDIFVAEFARDAKQLIGANLNPATSSNTISCKD
jgi:hypothetical protein